MMSPGIERIAAKAALDKELRFDCLAHHVTPELVHNHLRRIPLGTATGIDKITADEARTSFGDWVQPMLDQMHKKSYRAPPVKRVYIPKPGKTAKRPIGIPCIADRALQGAVTSVLNGIYEQDFLPCSYGGRPGRGAHQALANLKETTNLKGIAYVYEADLKNFFGSLDHQWLMKFINHRIGDPRILTLVRRWLRAGVIEDGRLYETLEGTPQGGPFSVLASNIYLHYVLDLWFERVVRPRLAGQAYLIRYIDDFVVCFQNKEDATRFEAALKSRLAKFSLSLEPSKTRLTAFGFVAAKRANQSGKKLNTIYFLGFNLICSRNHKGRFVIRFRTEKTRIKRVLRKLKDLMRSVMHEPLKDQQKRINMILVGFYRYFGLSSNLEVLWTIRERAKTLWKKFLSRRSQKGQLSWEAFDKIFDHHPFAQPKVYLSYRQMSDMAKL